MTIAPIPGFSEPFSSISHLSTAAVFFILSFYMLQKGRGNGGRIIGLLIYTFCLVFLFSMSGVYHLLEKGFTANYVLQILDHAGIYCLIAGTITPVHIILFRGVHRWLILIVVWTLSIIGITLTAVFFKQIPEWASIGFFVFLGWMGLYSIWHIYRVHTVNLVKYIVLGGLSYTTGALFEFLNWPIIIPGVVESHEVFHIFVVIGALFHWRLVYKISKYPISNKITILVREFPGSIFTGEATSEHAFFKASSISEMQELVMEWINENFHQEMKPKTVNFKYSKEENIYLNNSGEYKGP